MLLKFSTSDMLNTELADPQTGVTLYTVVSRATFIHGKHGQINHIRSRTTTIMNARGRQVAEIEWVGPEKRHTGAIRIMEQEPVKVADLFDGCESVRRLPDALCIPSRLDLVWIATRGSISIVNAETGQVEGRLHERCVNIGDRLVRPHFPGLGNNYLEFSDLPEDAIAELIVDYLLVDIMRRARFNLSKYDFSQVRTLERSKHRIVDALSSGRLRITRKLRRNTL